MIDELSDSRLGDPVFYKAVLDTIAAHIAVLDEQGTILAVNASWQRFGEANGMRDSRFGVGVNYFTVCRAAVDPIARASAAGIRDVLRRRRSSFYLEYPCHSHDEKRWFALRATPLADQPGFAVVAHENVTERVVAQRASTQPKQIEKLDRVVQIFPKWRDQIEKLATEHRVFLEVCEDYQELAAWIDDHHKSHRDRKLLEDSLQLIDSLAEEIWRFLNASAK